MFADTTGKFQPSNIEFVVMFHSGNYFIASKILNKAFTIQCVVPENIHTTPTEGNGNSWGVGGSLKTPNYKEVY